MTLDVYRSSDRSETLTEDDITIGMRIMSRNGEWRERITSKSTTGFSVHFDGVVLTETFNWSHLKHFIQETLPAS